MTTQPTLLLDKRFKIGRHNPETTERPTDHISEAVVAPFCSMTSGATE